MESKPIIHKNSAGLTGFKPNVNIKDSVSFNFFIIEECNHEIMSESIEEKIERLHKYIQDWAAPYHSDELIKQIKKDIEASKINDKKNYELLLDSLQKLLRLSCTRIYCKCGHEIQDHVNFGTNMQHRCEGKTANQQSCTCSVFTIQN